VSEGWHVGWKAIILYLRPYIDLSIFEKPARRKLKRWVRNYGLPVEHDVSKSPYIDPVMFELWTAKTRAKLRKQKSSKNAA
jgi:hypothetical protein